MAISPNLGPSYQAHLPYLANLTKYKEDIDTLSLKSFGSTISLRSIGSDGGTYSPRPPSSGHKRTKSVQGRRSKVKKQSSPYGAKPVNGSLNRGPGRKTGRELWVTAVQQGIGMSAESTGMDTWSGNRPNHAGHSLGRASASAYLLEQFLQSSSRSPKNHTRSTSARPGGKGPAYKDAEDYYDEIIELKQKINALRSENETIKSKMHKVEADNTMKAKRIEELINPNMQTNEMRRTLTDKKKDSGAVVTSLKHQLHSLERALRSKEVELSKLKNDFKCTNIEELQIQNEVYYEEIQRLNHLLTESRDTSAYDITEDIRRERTPEGKMRKLHEAVQKLADDNKRLLTDNNALKQDLKRAMETNIGNLNLSKDHEDMSRTELLAKIAELEQQIKEEEQRTSQAETPRTLQKGSLIGKARAKGKVSEEREKELLEEIEKLQDTIKKLKEDRTHYRKIADNCRTQLEKAGKLDREALQSHVQDAKDGQTLERKESLQRPRSRSQERLRDEEDEIQVQKMREKFAATRIQKNWRKHKQYKTKYEEQREEQQMQEEYEDAITAVQAAFRGHSARQQLLIKRQLEKTQSLEEGEFHDDDDDLVEDDIVLMQAAFRGHLARQNLLNDRIKLHREADDYPTSEPHFRRQYSGYDADYLCCNHSQQQQTRSIDTGQRRSLSRRENNSVQETIARSGSGLSSRRSYQNSPTDWSERERQRSRQGDRNTYDDDDSDDDDVVIGSTTSLQQKPYYNGIKQSSLRSGYTYKDKKYSKKTYPAEEKPPLDQRQSKVSVNNLRKGSLSWSSTVNGRMEDESEDDDVMVSLPSKKTKEKNKLNSSKGNSKLADTWANSGRKNSNNSRSSFLNRESYKSSTASWRQPQRNSFRQDDDENDDDDSDVVVAPAFAKKKPQRDALEDEMF